MPKEDDGKEETVRDLMKLTGDTYEACKKILSHLDKDKTPRKDDKEERRAKERRKPIDTKKRDPFWG